MKFFKQTLSVIFIIFVLAFYTASAQQTREGKSLLTIEERMVIRNQYGAPIRDSHGEKFNYSKNELYIQSFRASPVSREANAVDTVQSIPDSIPFWTYGAFGSGIGKSNIVIARAGDRLEMYMDGSTWTFGANNYWHALYYNAADGKYEQSFVSTHFSGSIKGIKVADVVGDSNLEILVALENGRIQLYDQLSKTWLGEVTTAASNLTDLEVADVDNDGQNELVICTTYYPGDHLYVYSPDGTLEWDLGTVGGYDCVVGQMDTDASLEIAFTDGHVVDAVSRTIQWTWAAGFGRNLEVADIDNDNIDELIAAEGWYFVWSYDVERQLPKWSIPISLDIGAIHLVDIDNDGVVELLVGEGQWGEILAFDTVTQVQEWSINNPEHGVTNIAVGDVDGDGKTEVLWGAGATSSGEDYLYVADWETRQIEWQNIHLDGPFIGPEIGDLDGDGEMEIVSVSYESDSGYGSGRILVFDSNRHLRAISGEIVSGYAWTGTHDLHLYDVDGDGHMEILVAADWLYDGVIEIYDFDSDNTFTLNWTNSTRPDGSPFYSVRAGDIDGDGQLEIVAGGGREHTGADGVFIYVYNYGTGDEEWHSMQMGSTWDGITGLEIADTDNDGFTEIIGMVDGGDTYIFNGTTKILDTILFGTYTSLALLHLDNDAPSIAFGDTDGNIDIYKYSGGGYQSIAGLNHGTGAIDGLSSNSTTERQLFGSDGTLNIGTTDGLIWTSPSYGTLFGKDTAFPPKIPAVYTTGTYAIVGFSYQASITVISPNGGENWQQQTSKDITWNAVGVSGDLKITLYKDGVFMGRIADNLDPASGSYSWNVGQYSGGIAAPGTGYTIKIKEKGTTVCDTGDAPFDISGISQYLALTSPNGGESWNTGMSQNITWDAAGISGSLKITLYKDGVFLGRIADNVDPASGSFTWTVGQHSGGTAPPGTGYTVKIKEKGTSVNDVSDASFSITDTPWVTLTSPNGGENWKIGVAQTITWNAPGVSGSLKITLYKDGVFLGRIADKLDPGDGSYTWTVGQYSGGIAPPGTGYTVKIKEKGTTVSDSSDGPFTLIE